MKDREIDLVLDFQEKTQYQPLLWAEGLGHRKKSSFKTLESSVANTGRHWRPPCWYFYHALCLHGTICGHSGKQCPSMQGLSALSDAHKAHLSPDKVPGCSVSLPQAFFF